MVLDKQHPFEKYAKKIMKDWEAFLETDLKDLRDVEEFTKEVRSSLDELLEQARKQTQATPTSIIAPKKLNKSQLVEPIKRSEYKSLERSIFKKETSLVENLTTELFYESMRGLYYGDDDWDWYEENFKWRYQVREFPKKSDNDEYKMLKKCLKAHKYNLPLILWDCRSHTPVFHPFQTKIPTLNITFRSYSHSPSKITFFSQLACLTTKSITCHAYNYDSASLGKILKSVKHLPKLTLSPDEETDSHWPELTKPWKALTKVHLGHLQLEGLNMCRYDELFKVLKVIGGDESWKERVKVTVDRDEGSEDWDILEFTIVKLVQAVADHFGIEISW